MICAYLPTAHSIGTLRAMSEAAFAELHWNRDEERLKNEQR
jgi:hypothetical protein